MLDNKDNNNSMVICIEIQVHNIFFQGGKCPIWPPPMGAYAREIQCFGILL